MSQQEEEKKKKTREESGSSKLLCLSSSGLSTSQRGHRGHERHPTRGEGQVEDNPGEPG